MEAQDQHQALALARSGRSADRGGRISRAEPLSRHTGKHWTAETELDTTLRRPSPWQPLLFIQNSVLRKAGPGPARYTSSTCDTDGVGMI